jgi:hypothetical protein
MMAEETAREFAERLYNLPISTPFVTFMTMVAERDAAVRAAAMGEFARIAERHVPSSPSADCEREMRRVGEDIAAAIRRATIPPQTEPAHGVGSDG